MGASSDQGQTDHRKVAREPGLPPGRPWSRTRAQLASWHPPASTQSLTVSRHQEPTSSSHLAALFRTPSPQLPARERSVVRHSEV